MANPTLMPWSFATFSFDANDMVVFNAWMLTAQSYVCLYLVWDLNFQVNMYRIGLHVGCLSLPVYVNCLKKKNNAGNQSMLVMLVQNLEIIAIFL